MVPARGRLHGKATSNAVAYSTLFAALWLVLPIGAVGAWDPFEIDAADLARRIAVHALGASTLARAGDPATIPTLTDLGMGELPFTSMALSFRLFGVHDWSGRLPLALFALAGASSLALLLARLVSGRAAFASVVALVTMPLYFVHARTMLGDAVSMAAFAMALSGLALWLVEDSPSWRLGASALAVAGLGAGFLSRGLLFGVAAPAIAVGLAGVASGSLVARGTRRGSAAALLGFGALAGVGFLVAALPRVGADLPVARVVGFALESPEPDAATFDRVVRQLGHALFPWSAVLPACLGRLFFAPAGGAELAPRDAFARVLVLSAAGTALLAATLVVPWAGALPFFGVAALAASVGVAAHDLEASARASRAAALVTAALAIVLYVDLSREPSRTLEGFAQSTIPLSPAFESVANGRLKLVAAVFLVLAFFVWFDGASWTPGAGLRAWLAERRAGALSLSTALVSSFQGNLVFVLVVIEAALLGLAATLFIGTRARWASIVDLPRHVVDLGLDAWWLAVLGVVGGGLAFVAARDALRAARAALGVGRGAMLAITGGLAGALSSFAFYPALAAELTPKGAFETLASERREGEPLALLGTSPKAGAFYSGAAVPAFRDVGDAYAWLTEGRGAERRFLLLKARELPKLNSLFRAGQGRNVPVLDARSSQTLLVSNQSAGLRDANPLADIVLDAAPLVAHPVSARFLEHLELLGWEVVDASGKRVDELVPQRPYRVRTVYRVKKRIPGNWTAFLHLDGHGKRHNGDHAVTHGRYPLSLWQPGDVIVDELELELEPNFVPGEYWVMCGFFQGQTRLRVTDGANRDDRVILGRVMVR
jgi:hypothetical protein